MCADEVRASLRPLSDASLDGPTVGRAQAGGHPRRPHRGARRHQPVDHRARGPGRRPPAAGRERRHPGRRRDGAGRRSGPHGPRRPGSGSPAGRPRPAARRRPGPPRPRACRATSSRLLDDLGRRGVLQVLVEGGATRGRRSFTGPAWSTSTSCTWPRPCSAATTASRCSPGPARRPWPAMLAGPDRARSSASARICGSTAGGRAEVPYREQRVHRNRRGARAAFAAAEGGRFEFAAPTVIEDSQARRLHRRQRLLPHRGRRWARAGGPPTRSPRPSRRTNLGAAHTRGSGQPGAPGAAERPPRRPPGPGPRRRRRRDRDAGPGPARSARRRDCCATWSRRAPSPSTASA